MRMPSWWIWRQTRSTWENSATRRSKSFPLAIRNSPASVFLGTSDAKSGIGSLIHKKLLRMSPWISAGRLRKGNSVGFWQLDMALEEVAMPGMTRKGGEHQVSRRLLVLDAKA